jgi:hypothetical protein
MYSTGILPNITHTQAGGSPPLTVPKLGDTVRLRMIPFNSPPTVQVGRVGVVIEVKQSRFRVRFGSSTTLWANTQQIEVVTSALAFSFKA